MFSLGLRSRKQVKAASKPLARHDDIKVIYESTLSKLPARDGNHRVVAEHVPLRAMP
jgi:hypothetical protein